MTTTVMDARIKEVIFNLLGQIAPEANLEELGPGDDIRMLLDIDSFDFLNFLIGLNDKLGVEVPEADYGKLITLQDLMSYLSARVK
jgi:acyl carrier protein